jgi:hypothetical protein
MSAFERAGIYVILDMRTSDFFLSRKDPEWTRTQRNGFAQIMDAFQKYDNLLGFFAANEIVNDANTTESAAYVKAAIADMKAYRDLMQYRSIPIGYSIADVASLRGLQQDYFNCGDESSSADFLGTSMYAWCGDSSMSKSGYDELYEQLDGYSIPYFFSENGCRLDNEDRNFDDQVAILGPEMDDRLSGNIIYTWANDNSTNFGLVSYENPEDGTGTMKTLQDYSNLNSHWATLEPTGVKASNYDPTLTRRDCPAYTSGVWSLRADEPIATLGLDGFTTPTNPRTTSTAVQTRSGTRASGPATSTPAGQLSNNGDPQGKQGKKRVSTGVIAGSVLGALVFLAVILAVILLLLRRKKKQRAAKDALPSEREESDKMFVGPDGTGDHPHDFNGPQYTELAGNSAVQELDPARGEVTTMRANEMSGGGGQMGELHDGRNSPPLINLERNPDSITVQEHVSAPVASPYVEAQRKVEMSWLESEEARLRQRREQLMIQSGGET